MPKRLFVCYLKKEIDQFAPIVRAYWNSSTIRRQKARATRLVRIFQNRQRLRHENAVDAKCWHKSLPVVGLEVLLPG